MKMVHVFSGIFVLLGLWIVLDHVRSPELHLETVRDLPLVQSTPEPARAVQPLSTASIQPVVPEHVNVNQGSKAQLIGLPGVGEKMAEKIIQGRPYQSLQDLDRVKGIGPRMLQKLGPLVEF